MGRGILKGLLKGLEEAAAKLPEKRKDGNVFTYRIPEALKSALAVFYFLHPSLLNFQQEMRQKQKRDNLETLFGGKKYTLHGANQKHHRRHSARRLGRSIRQSTYLRR
jgi:hypothetical protein